MLRDQCLFDLDGYAADPNQVSIVQSVEVDRLKQKTKTCLVWSCKSFATRPRPGLSISKLANAF